MRNFTFLAVFLFVSLVTFGQVPTNGLIGYYPLNNNGNDLTPYNHNGVIVNAVSDTGRYGSPATALGFNGLNSKVIVGDVDEFENTSTLSFNVWVSVEALGSGQMTQIRPILAKWKSTTELPVSSWHFFLTDSIFFIASDGASFSMVSFPITFGNNDWTMLTGCFSSGTFKLYVDGVDAGTKNMSVTHINNSTTSFLIGDWYDIYDPNYNTFKGKIDDVRIYNRTLDSTDARLLFNEFLCVNTVYDTTTITVYDTVKVTVYDTTKISVTDTLIINAKFVGIPPPNNINTVKVYPNPAKDFIIIDNGDYIKMNGYTIKITTALGQEVFSSSITQQQFLINTSMLAGRGTYFIYLYDPSNNISDVRKIILQ